MAAGEAGNEPQAHGGTDRGNTTRDDVQGDRVFHGNTGGVEDLRRVVHGRVDAGQLVGDAQDDTDVEELAGPLDLEDLGQRPLFLLGLGALDLEHLVELGGDVILLLVTHALEGANGLDDAQVGGIPAGGLGHHADADPQGDGGQRAQDEHVAPGQAVTGRGNLGDVDSGTDSLPGHGSTGMAEHVARGIDGVAGQRDGRAALPAGDDGVHGEGHELTEDDHHLVGRDEDAAQSLGRGLSEEDGNRRRGTTDGEAEDDARQVENPDVRGDRTSDGAKQEDDSQQRDVVATPEAVGQATTEECAGGSADTQQAANPAFFEGGHVQAAGVAGHVHVGQSTSNHAGVVAEEERTQRGDGSDRAQGALLARGRGRLDERAHLVGRVIVNRWNV